MKKPFFFYDLETSGLNAKYQRIMQFAGVRTNQDLTVIDEPIDTLVTLTTDILPEPQAILVTGTTPQKTIEEGISEPVFCQLLMNTVFTPGTTVIGFNNIRFDDEFVRHTLWRNFYDPYEWSWSEGRSRWDLLDVVRMTRALRPEGINWPVDSEGKPTNRLELLAKANNLKHDHAHDAMSDVEATIEVAKLIRTKQPKLFEYLLKMRDRKELAKLINLKQPKPFVYSSGRYGSQYDFTTVGIPIAPGTRPGAVLIYDLRFDPSNYKALSADDMKYRLFPTFEERKRDDLEPFPVKELAYNKCPVVAPLGVIDTPAWKRLGLTPASIEKNLRNLNKTFIATIESAFSQRDPYPAQPDVEGQLYDNFIEDQDKARCRVIQTADEATIQSFQPDFIDKRLTELFFRYKSRHFPKTLTEAEQARWHMYLQDKFEKQAPHFMQTLEELAHKTSSDEQAQFLLEELRLWLEQIAPVES